MSQDFDPIYLISGKNSFLRGRGKRNFLSMFSGAIEEISSSNLGSRLSSRAFFAEPTLYVLTEVEERGFELLSRHLEKPYEEVVVLIVAPSIKKASPLGKLAESVGPKKHLKFEEPPPFKKFDVACSFLGKEVRALGAKISAEDARKVVSAVGDDFGFLYFQAWKMAQLAKAKGEGEITTEIVESLSIDVFEAPLFPLVEAIGLKQEAKCLKSLWKIAGTHTAPAMKVCRFTGSFALKWAATRNLIEKEASEEEALRVLKSSKGYYKNSLFRIASRWSSEDLQELASICAETEQAIFQGLIDPWTLFCSKVYRLVSS